MSGKRQPCIATSQLRDFLAEQLNERDESSILLHIDRCLSCQRSLEEIAGGENDWNAVRQQLSCFADADLSFNDLMENLLSNPDRDLHLRRLLDFLGPTDSPEMLGRLGSYEICSLVGVGSTGLVLKAHEPRLNRFVAIKVLSPNYSVYGPARARFEREGKAVASVSDPHVVPIYGVDEYRGVPFIVMQFVSGGSLNHRIRSRGVLNTCEVTRLGMQIARGLSAAHGQGIVHRDVKPANVMLESTVDRAMVTDFGLARVADDTSATRSGVVAGTPQYMSPEQARGETVDPSSDLFSLGSVLYTACTGHPPFRSETVFGVIQRVCHTEPRAIQEVNPEIAPWLEAFISKLHAKEKQNRFESADQVARILSEELAHLQNPVAVAMPSRDWLPSVPPIPSRPSVRSWRNFMTICVPLLVVSLLAYPLADGVDKKSDSVSPSSPLTSAEPRQESPKPTSTKIASPKGTASPAEPASPADAERLQEASSSDAIATSRQGIPGEIVAVEGSYIGDVVDGYTLYLPESYSESSSPYPVIVYLQGGLGVGGTVERVNRWGVPRLLQESRDTDGENRDTDEVKQYLRDTFVVVSPHIKRGQYFDQAEAIAEVIHEVLQKYRTDAKRVYLTGLSRGGSGTWESPPRPPNSLPPLHRLPGGLAGLDDYAALAEVPIWVAHNTGDQIFEFNETANAVLKLELLSKKPFYRIYTPTPENSEYLSQSKVLIAVDVEEHDAWTKVYRDPAIYKWLLTHRR